MKFCFCPYCGGNAKVIYRDDNMTMRWMCLQCDFIGDLDELVKEAMQ